MELTSLTIDAARNAVQERNTTAVALAEAHYAHIQKEDGQIGAFLTLSRERALQQAERMDRIVAEGRPLPPLGGVPVGIKDVMSTRGVRTTAGSKILDKYVPPYDCTAVAKLETAGAVILGKMNCDEFAMGSSNENSGFHPVRNPRDLSRVPGDLREVPQPRWPRAWRWLRSDPTLEVRSASPLPSAVSWG
jgi:aspartyl-tRNA(Asn)/glutamyl-tRNA(Gln) amidotransferase subunit A